MPNQSISQIRDEMAATQALIDQAYAHLMANANKLSKEQVNQFRDDLDYRQLRLDFSRSYLDRQFPK